MAEFPDKAGGQPQLPGPKRSRPKPQAVISGAHKSTPSVMQRLRHSLFNESPRNLGAQIGKDIIVPRFKMGLQETLNSFIAGVLWGNIGQQPMGRSPNITTRPHIQYSQQSTHQAAVQAQSAVVPRSSGNYEDIVCPTEQAATNLLAQAMDYINEYNLMSIGDLYEMAGLPTQISDDSFGWHNITGARIYQTADGYEIKMPKPTTI